MVWLFMFVIWIRLQGIESFGIVFGPWMTRPVDQEGDVMNKDLNLCPFVIGQFSRSCYKAIFI